MLPFFTLKKLFRVEIFRLNLKNSSKYQNKNPKYKTLAKICEKYIFYGLLFVLCGRFGDSFGRLGDSVCMIQETPGLGCSKID